MAKQTKPKAKRTQVKDLPVAQQELTAEKASKVKGGIAGAEKPIVKEERMRRTLTALDQS